MAQSPTSFKNKTTQLKLQIISAIISVANVNVNVFKTNIICVLLTVPLNLDNATKNALIPFLIRSGSKKYKTQLEINKHLEEMYGANFNLRNR